MKNKSGEIGLLLSILSIITIAIGVLVGTNVADLNTLFSRASLQCDYGYNKGPKNGMDCGNPNVSCGVRVISDTFYAYPVLKNNKSYIRVEGNFCYTGKKYSGAHRGLFYVTLGDPSQPMCYKTVASVAHQPFFPIAYPLCDQTGMFANHEKTAPIPDAWRGTDKENYFSFLIENPGNNECLYLNYTTNGQAGGGDAGSNLNVWPIDHDGTGRCGGTKITPTNNISSTPQPSISITNTPQPTIGEGTPTLSPQPTSIDCVENALGWIDNDKEKVADDRWFKTHKYGDCPTHSSGTWPSLDMDCAIADQSNGPSTQDKRIKQDPPNLYYKHFTPSDSLDLLTPEKRTQIAQIIKDNPNPIRLKEKLREFITTEVRNNPDQFINASFDSLYLGIDNGNTGNPVRSTSLLVHPVIERIISQELGSENRVARLYKPYIEAAVGHSVSLSSAHDLYLAALNKCGGNAINNDQSGLGVSRDFGEYIGIVQFWTEPLDTIFSQFHDCNIHIVRKQYCSPTATPIPTTTLIPTTQPYTSPTPTITPPVAKGCFYHADSIVRIGSDKGQILTKTDNELSVQWGVSNNMQSQTNPAGLFGSRYYNGINNSEYYKNNAIHTYHNENHFFYPDDKNASYKRGDIAWIKVMGINLNKYKIIGKYCKPLVPGAPGCPVDIATQAPNDLIYGFKVDCNLHVEYGWIVEKKQVSCPYTPSDTCRIRDLKAEIRDTSKVRVHYVNPVGCSGYIREKHPFWIDIVDLADNKIVCAKTEYATKEDMTSDCILGAADSRARYNEGLWKTITSWNPNTTYTANVYMTDGTPACLFGPDYYHFSTTGPKPTTTPVPERNPTPYSPTITPQPTNSQECSDGKRDINGNCDPACCANNNDCPSGQTCTIANGRCRSGRSCKNDNIICPLTHVSNNGPIHTVFVPQDYNDYAEFEKDVKASIIGLQSTNLGSSRINDLKFSMLSKLQPVRYFDPVVDEDEDYFYSDFWLDQNAFLDFADQCNAIVPVLLINSKEERGQATLYPTSRKYIVMTNISQKNRLYTTLPHELAHAIGWVMDEYVYPTLPPPTPTVYFGTLHNCTNSINCSAWNGKGYECHTGCTYDSYNRSSYNSIMRFNYSPLFSFNQFNKLSLEIWDTYTNQLKTQIRSLSQTINTKGIYHTILKTNVNLINKSIENITLNNSYLQPPIHNDLLNKLDNNYVSIEVLDKNNTVIYNSHFATIEHVAIDIFDSITNITKGNIISQPIKNLNVNIPYIQNAHSIILKNPEDTIIESVALADFDITPPPQPTGYNLCGNTVCDSSIGENNQSCPIDCQIKITVTPTPTQTMCKTPDLNNDGIINTLDFGKLIANYEEDTIAEVDVNCDGKINAQDISLIITLLGKSQ